MIHSSFDNCYKGGWGVGGGTPGGMVGGGHLGVWWGETAGGLGVGGIHKGLQNSLFL